jgi:branched-chain amino acid transport system permease protein
VLIPFLILSLAALGLNILVGYCGQISLGTGAFMAVGAYAAYNFHIRIDGMPLIASLLLGGVFATGVGVLFGIPVAADQGPLSRGRDTGGAVLRRLGVPAHPLVHQRLVVGIGQRQQPAGVRAADRVSGQKYLFCLAFVTVFA